MRLPPVWRRFRRFWGFGPGADVDDEFAFHVEARVEELVAQGRSPDAAREEALRGFGDMRAVKTICRTLAHEKERVMRRANWWSDWRHDVRFALRQLKSNPVLTAVLMVIIALGIGATVAIFSALYPSFSGPFAFDDCRIVLFEKLAAFRRHSSVGHFTTGPSRRRARTRRQSAQRPDIQPVDGEPERVSRARATPATFRGSPSTRRSDGTSSSADVACDARTVVGETGLWQGDSRPSFHCRPCRAPRWRSTPWSASAAQEVGLAARPILDATRLHAATAVQLR